MPSTAATRSETAKELFSALARPPNSKKITIKAKPDDLRLMLIVNSAVEAALDDRVENMPPLHDVLEMKIEQLWPLGAASRQNFKRFLKAIENRIKARIEQSENFEINKNPGSPFKPTLKVNELILKIIAIF